MAVAHVDERTRVRQLSIHQELLHLRLHINHILLEISTSLKDAHSFPQYFQLWTFDNTPTFLNEKSKHVQFGRITADSNHQIHASSGLIAHKRKKKS